MGGWTLIGMNSGLNMAKIGENKSAESCGVGLSEGGVIFYITAGHGDREPVPCLQDHCSEMDAETLKGN